MGFFSFLGRVLFASLFILSAWQMFNDFGVKGGPAAKELAEKLSLSRTQLSSKLGLSLRHIDVKQVVAVIIALKGLGGLLFVFGCVLGAYLLILYLALVSPILYDFYNHSPTNPKFSVLMTEFLQSVALLGALLFFIGMKNSIPMRSIKKKASKSKAA